uniref:C1q domain-containing protein n=1 Tax=Magallana gigas TaxID=29159 RepID=A0A8W8IM86_MAGGI
MLNSCQGGWNEFTKSNPGIRRGRLVPEGRQSQIAFHTHLTHNINNLGVHQAIEFDYVLLNEGTGYSVYTGHFVAPVSGLYVFAWTITSGDYTCIVYDVVKNNEILVHFISDAADHNDWAVSSGTAVTRMNSGDRVWIRVSDIFVPCSHTVYGTGFGRGRLVPEGRQSQIAFHVHLTRNINNLGVRQAIEFNHVLLNDGNGYSVYTGHFVAPVSGLYVFAWTISSGDGTCMIYDVVKNNEILVHFISDAAQHTDWAVSSGTAVTRMNSGDRVWIRVSDIYIPCSHTVYGTGLGTSSFAGYLLN